MVDRLVDMAIDVMAVLPSIRWDIVMGWRWEELDYWYKKTARLRGRG